MIDAVPAAERWAIVELLEVGQLRFAEITHDVGTSYRYVDFPIDAVLSVVITLANGDTCEVMAIGREGASGMEAAGGGTVQRTTFCQVPGRSARMPNAAFMRTLRQSPAFERLARRNAEARRFSIEQSCACNAVHTVKQRCARWLLMTHDRVGRDTFPLTQNFLSIMLGVRRPSVTAAAEALHAQGAIRYHRGIVVIEDRASLEAASCECYAVTAKAYEGALRPEASSSAG